MTQTMTSPPASAVPTPRPRLAVTLGDPAGIGPEVVLKALADPTLAERAEITVVGNRDALQMTCEALRSLPHAPLFADLDQWPFLDVPVEPDLLRQIQLGQGNAASGAIAFQTLDRAIAHALSGQVQGIVTAPIAKSAWAAAGYRFPGQTEVLATRAGVERYGMLFVARSPHTGWILRTLLATTHIPLRQVPDALTPDLMTRKLDLLVECLAHDFGIQAPQIAIAGLNPHSGEAGQLGREEVDWLIPWMQQMGDRFPQVHLDGPIPPDTLWVRPGQAWYGGHEPAHDAYLALYHDQGLIPVKLMAFDRAVNTTIGLPFVRTSPDHGTAFDIAGRGIADASSLSAALILAADLVQQRAWASSK